MSRAVKEIGYVVSVSVSGVCFQAFLTSIWNDKKKPKQEKMILQLLSNGVNFQQRTSLIGKSL
jgi:hypothetical protein